MSRLLVVCVAGLSARLADGMPGGRLPLPGAALRPSFPALTCPLQATASTGQLPASHGIIANGLFAGRLRDDRIHLDLSSHAEARSRVSFWEQANPLVQSPRIWQALSSELGKPVRTAMLFWQNSMPGFGPPDSRRSAADIVLTPKPEHSADGRTLSRCFSEPGELAAGLEERLGVFPLQHYWGPMAGLPSSEWIVRAAEQMLQVHKPDLTLVYVPHMDYCQQQHGPDSTQTDQALGQLAGLLESLCGLAGSEGVEVLLWGDYGIVPVRRAVFPNQALRAAGLLRCTDHPAGGLAVDWDDAPSFAMVDHQIAHVYCRDAASVQQARELLEPLPGVASVIPRDELSGLGMDHPRSGDLLVLAEPDSWFGWWWAEPAELPPFARTVEIHEKPGYDPLELFFEPSERRISWDPGRVRGSHGLVDAPAAHGLLACSVDPGVELTDTRSVAHAIRSIVMR